jgi:hypothetical protein
VSVESREFRINLHGRTLTGTLSSDDEGGLDDLTDTLLESGEVESVEVRDPGSTVWSVREPACSSCGGDGFVNYDQDEVGAVQYDCTECGGGDR